MTKGSGGAADRDVAAAAAATADPVATGARPASGSGSALPFTGSVVALLAGLGLLALGGGVALRRLARRVTRAGA